MNFQKSWIAVHFSVCSTTNFGESVYISGNCPELGSWDPTKGFRLETNSMEYPIWFSKNPLILQKMTTIEFKICILASGQLIRWQNLKKNRVVLLKTSCSIFLTEGQSQQEYGEEGQEAASTKMDSTKKGYLSQIEEQQNDDEPNQYCPLEHSKRSRSSKKPKLFANN